MDHHLTTDRHTGERGTAGERVLSVRVEPSDRGRATLRVRFARTAAGPDPRPDEGHELQWRGDERDLRERARALAAVHDLVPVWEDRSWLQGDTRRPPASCYLDRGR
ncbi:MAG: hypothetical protein ACOYOP_11670 [Microthrixaceae bacterium]